MAQLDDIYTYTLEALSAMMDNRTSRESRQKYTEYLTQLEESQQCSAVLCRVLTDHHTNHHESIYILTLTILHKWITRWWDRIAPNEQNSIRSIISNLLSDTMQVQHSSNFSSKLASIITDIVERQFPQQWPTFVPEILSVWSQGPQYKQEIILKTLQFLFVDCTDVDFSSHLSTTRRQDILNAFQSHLRQLLHISYQYFVSHLMPCCEHPEQSLAEHKRGIVLLLQLLQPLAVIVPPDDLYLDHQNFLLPLVKALSIQGIQLETAKTLHAFFKLSIRNEHVLLILDVFFSDEKKLTLPTDPDDISAFIQHYMKSVMSFVSLHVKQVFSRDMLRDRESQVHRMLADIVQCMATPSRRACGEIIADWIKIFKSEDIMIYSQRESLAAALLENYLAKSLKPKFILEDSLEEEEWYSVEFDDREDWLSFFNLMSAQVLHLSNLLCEKFPHLMMQFYRNKVKQAIRMEQDFAAFCRQQHTIPTNEFFELKSVFYGLVHVYPHALNTIFQQVNKWKAAAATLQEGTQTAGEKEAILQHLQQAEDIVQIGFDLLTTLHQWEPQGPNMFRNRLRLLTQSYPVFNCSSAHLFSYMQLLFSVVTTAIPTTTAHDFQRRVFDPNSWKSIDYNHIDQTMVLVENREEAATSIAVLIQKCPQAFQTEAAILPLLNSLAQIMTNGNIMLSIHDSMRDSLVLLSTYVQDVNMQGQILDLAFQDLLQRTQTLVQEVFPSPEVILQAIITPHQPPAANTDTTSAPSTLTSVFLDRCNKLRKYLQSFYASANMIEGDALHGLAFSRRQDVWVDHKEFSMDEIAQHFPLIRYWMALFSMVLPALQHFMELWSPRIVSLLSSGPAYEEVKCLVYGPSFIDSCRKCKMDIEESLPEHKKEHILKEQMFLLSTSFHKVLGLACKHHCLHYFPIEILTQIKQLCEYSVVLEHGHFNQFLKYFAEPLVVHSTPSFQQRYLPELLSALLPQIMRRVTTTWNLEGKAAGSATTEEEQFFTDLYLNSRIYSPFIKGDMATQLKDIMAREVTSSVSDFITACFAMKGVLAQAIPLTNDSAMDDNFFLVTRKKLLQHSIVASKSPSSSRLADAFLQSVTMLLSVPDSGACKSALQVLTVLTTMSVTDQRLLPFLSRDAFASVLVVLLFAEPWSQGLEWDLVEYVLEMYRICILDPLQLINSLQSTGSGKNAQMTGWSTPSNSCKTITTYPRDKLKETNLASPQEIEQLEKDLMKNLKSKKKLRDTMKDFLLGMSRKLLGKDGLTAKGSTLLKLNPKVKDFQEKFIRQSRKPAAKANYDDLGGVGSLFG